MGSAVIDLAVVGGGAAGMAAAIYAVRKNLRARVFEREALGGQSAVAIWVENYPGFRKIRGEELMNKWAEHLASFGVEVEEANGVSGIKEAGNGFELALDSGEKAMAKAVLIATGTENRKLGIPGERELFGKGVSYCANCDGPFFRGKRVAVIGGGNSGVTNALYLAEMAKETTLIEFLPKLNCDEVYLQGLEESGIRVLTNTQAMEIMGSERVEAIKVRERESGEEREIPVEGIFIYAGLSPRNELAKKLGLELDERGFIRVDGNNMASVDGVFAAGDVRAEALAQIVWAAGDGAKAALAVYDYIRGAGK
jgi:thioredoxin reductase (NADPH)